MIGSGTIFVIKNRLIDMYICSAYLTIELRRLSNDPRTSFEIIRDMLADVTPTLKNVELLKVKSVVEATQCKDPNRPRYDEHAGDCVFMLDLDAGTLLCRKFKENFRGYDWVPLDTDNDKMLATIDPRHLHMFKLAMSQISINLPVFTIINKARGELVGTSVVYVPTTNGFYKLTQKPVPTKEDKLTVDFRDLSFSTHMMVPYSELMASLPPRRN